MRIVGIDFGKKQVGVAYSEGVLASPYATFPTKRAAAELVKLCRAKKLEQIVVGLPEGPTRSATKEFIGELAATTNVPVVWVDETLSSEVARRELIAALAGRKQRKAREHAVAAAVILQTYLDGQNV